MTASDPLLSLPDADDDTLLRALENVEYSALRATLYSLTGDPVYCADLQLQMTAMSGRVALPVLTDEQEKAWLRDRAFQLLRGIRDSTLELRPPAREDFPACLRMLLGREVPEADHDFWWEELAVEPVPRASAWYSRGEETHSSADFHVLVIGAGLGGITAAVHLRAAGIPFTLVDSQESAGGTWAQNRYPGIRIDLTSRAYNFSFAPNWDWKDYFATGGEICAYIESCIDAHDLRGSIFFRTEVVSTAWSDVDAAWTTVLRGPDGTHRTVRSRAIIAATGLFGRVKHPAIDGLADFRGDVVHTSEWRDSVELRDRHIGLIGTGSSGVQVAAALAEAGRTLSVFQRTGSWVGGNPNYTKPIPESERWLTRHLPYYGHWLRVQACYTIGDERIPLFQVDSAWRTPGSVSQLNLALRHQMTEYIHSQLQDHPDLLAKCVPTWPPLARRTPFDNGWFAALRRPNVELVTDGIAQVDADGVALSSGRHIRLDVLVLATGFRTDRFLWPVEVSGTGGVALRDVWASDGPYAYLGTAVPRFPNLFLLYGPNSNPITGGIPLFEELAVRYALNCIYELRKHDWRAMSVRPEVCQQYNKGLAAALAETVYSRGGQGSYYYDEHGRNVTQFPFTTADYWRWTRQVNLDDFIIDIGG